MPELKEFEGRWRIARRIEDAIAGATGLFDGAALFAPEEGGLRYEEHGALKLPGQPAMRASRTYLWREGAGEIEVLFADGRPFHRIQSGARVVQDWHDCMPDTYEVTYTFTRWPEWRAIWKVTGPRKDYVSISDYRR